MSLKNLIIFFPNFSKGGIEKISLLLSNFFIKKKIKIKFLTGKKIDEKKLNFRKEINFYSPKKYKLFSSNIYCTLVLFKILLKENRKDTVIFSLQNNILSILVSKFLGFKIVVRSSAPIDYINNDNSLVRKIKLFIKIKIYSFSNLIISNSKKSAKKIRAKLANKKKVIRFRIL